MAPRAGRLLLRRWVPYATLAVALCLTVLGTLYVAGTNKERDVLQFETAVDETRDLIEIRLNTYVEVLRATAALFRSSTNVSAEEFGEFMRSLRVAERYPGIQAMGFAAYVRRSDLESPSKSLDARRWNVAIWPQGNREEYAPAVYVEPVTESNRTVLGFDMLTDPVRRAAMERARDSGEPSASGLVMLVAQPNAPRRRGLLVYHAVYREGAPLATVEARRRALVGYVYSPFRSQDLLTGIVSHPSNLAFQVYDGTRGHSDALLYATTLPAQRTPQDVLQTTQTLEVAGRTWTLAFEAYRHFAGTSPLLAPLTAASGLLLSLALFAIMRAQVSAWERSNSHASALRRSEEALRETSERLRKADRAKDEFLATLSHELRTPLNAVLGWLSMVRSGKLGEARREQALDVIYRNAQAQARLIEDLLDVSRIVTGNVRLDVRPIQLAPIVRGVVETQRPAAEQKGIHLRTSMGDDMPAILGDPNRLQQIIANLLSNAIKFTPPRGRVDVTLQADDATVTLVVTDTGVGISPEFLPHVFERFSQADSSNTRTHSGVGLGLAIVSHLVECHGGTIQAFSDGLNRGARFVVRFPIATAEALEAEPVAAVGVGEA
jgi:signal transduction histidine kinase